MVHFDHITVLFLIIFESVFFSFIFVIINHVSFIFHFSITTAKGIKKT